MMHILLTKGLQHSVCDQSFYNGPVSKFWAYAFVLSKAPELGGSSSLLYPLSPLLFPRLLLLSLIPALRIRSPHPTPLLSSPSLISFNTPSP